MQVLVASPGLSFHLHAPRVSPLRTRAMADNDTGRRHANTADGRGQSPVNRRQGDPFPREKTGETNTPLAASGDGR